MSAPGRKATPTPDRHAQGAWSTPKLVGGVVDTGRPRSTRKEPGEAGVPGRSWLRRPRNGGEAGAYPPPSSQAWTTGPGPHSAGSAPRGRLPGSRPLPFTLSLIFLGSAGSVGRRLLPGASTPARTADLPSLRSPPVGESRPKDLQPHRPAGLLWGAGDSVPVAIPSLGGGGQSQVERRC